MAHGALGRHLPGGTPSAQTLEAALRLRVDWVECDVVGTADGDLVLRHDPRLPDGRPVAALTRAELRGLLPGTLTIDEAVEIVAGRRPLLLDVKGDATVGPLGRWLSRRQDPGQFALCTESIPALLRLRAHAPRIARWPSLPDLGEDRPGWQGWMAAMLRQDHAPRHLARLAGEAGHGITQLRPSTHDRGVARLGGLPWRLQLPGELESLARRVDAAAFSFHHWLVTPDLCEATHRLGLTAVAWTVNDAGTARSMRDCGVDLITTDDVAGLRHALDASAGARG